MSQRVRTAHEIATALEAGETTAQVKRRLRMPSRAADRLIADAQRSGSNSLQRTIEQLADLELASRGGGSGGGGGSNGGGSNGGGGSTPPGVPALPPIDTIPVQRSDFGSLLKTQFPGTTSNGGPFLAVEPEVLLDQLDLAMASIVCAIPFVLPLVYFMMKRLSR